ncbi:MAG: UbiD family decarboxylase [Candidatus Diapherotrites archaeon]
MTGLRDFVEQLEKEGKLAIVEKEVDAKFEIAAILKSAEGKAVKFTNVKGHDISVVGGVGSSRELIAEALGVEQKDLLFRMADAIKNPKEPKVVKDAPCQEIVWKGKDADLTKIPILTHYEKDGGPYLSSSVLFVNNEKWGQNMATHRMMLYGPNNKLVVRVCARDTMEHLNEGGGEIDAAICIGTHPAVQLASATRVAIDQDELGIANALVETPTVKCLTKNITVPSEAEIVLEGKLSSKERVGEGPFVDITGTYDFPKREEPVFTVETITMRKDTLFHALLPGFSEHRLYMGMPREPTIYNEVNNVCECKNVVLTPGGCGWLQAIVQIKKKNADDGKKAIEAAYKGHSSLKHVLVIDEDIDIYDRDQLEWAIATRFQANNDAVIEEYLKGSSVDPSGTKIEGSDRQKTTRVGMDATIPADRENKDFARPYIPGEEKIKLEDYKK